MTMNEARRRSRPTDNAHGASGAHPTSGSTRTDRDRSALARLDAIEAHLDEMLIQLDQIRENLTPLLAELAPPQTEQGVRRRD